MFPVVEALIIPAIYIFAWGLVRTHGNLHIQPLNGWRPITFFSKYMEISTYKVSFITCLDFITTGSVCGGPDKSK